MWMYLEIDDCRILVNASRIVYIEETVVSKPGTRKKKNKTALVVHMDDGSSIGPVHDRTLDDMIDALGGGDEADVMADDIECDDEGGELSGDYTLIGDKLLSQAGADVGMRLHGRGMTEAPLLTRSELKKRTTPKNKPSRRKACLS